MVNAFTPLIYAAGFKCRAYDEQIIARRRRGVQPQDGIWFPASRHSGARLFGANPESRDGTWRWIPGPREDACPGMTVKKEPPFPAAFEVDNREASNRVDRSHSVSKQGRFKSYSRKLNRS
jgi:hypothetical protein